MTAALSWFGYTSVRDIREEAKIQMERGVADATASLDRRLDARLSKEFVDVHGRVEARLNQELDRPSIQKTIDEGVEQVLRHRVNSLVRGSVAPVEEKMTSFGEKVRVQSLIVAAQGHDRHAFDELWRLSQKNGGTKQDQELSRTARAAITDLVRQRESKRGSYQTPELTLELEERKAPLSEIFRIATTDASPIRRSGAILALITHQETNLTSVGPLLKQVLLKEEDLGPISSVWVLLEWKFRADVPMLDIEAAVAWIDRNMPKAQGSR